MISLKKLLNHGNCSNAITSSVAGSDMTIDDRWFTMAAATTMDVPSSVVYLYPRLVPLVDLTEEPLPIRCSADKMADNGVYLFGNLRKVFFRDSIFEIFLRPFNINIFSENGIYMFLWLGLAAPSDWVASVFGVPSTAQVDTDRNRLPVLDNPLSEKVREYIGLVASNRHRSMRVSCC